MPRGRAYRFIETPVGQDLNTRDFQRTVRSHAASVSHPGQSIRRRTRTRRRNDGEGVIAFDADSVESNNDSEPRQLPITTTAQTGELATLARGHRIDNDQLINTTPQQYPYQLYTDPLSGNTFSPLQNLPTYHKPYLPGIINHYIYNLTIPIPELDGTSPEPLFRAAWLPVVFHDPVVFQVVVLFAATHYTTYADPSQFNDLHLELLSLKQSALLALIQRVRGEQSTPSISANLSRDSYDTLIAGAAKMASYEAIFGAAEAFHLHMSTVTRLLRSYGGLETLGMNGFLSRLLSFIDTNSAFLLGTNLYLVEFGRANRMPLRQPFPAEILDDSTPQPNRELSNTNVVNLERFIGLANATEDSGVGL